MLSSIAGLSKVIEAIEKGTLAAKFFLLVFVGTELVLFIHKHAVSPHLTLNVLA